MVMTYSYAKVQGQRSVGSEDRVETNGPTDRRTDGGDCITSHANAVGKKESKQNKKNTGILLANRACLVAYAKPRGKECK